jgi:xylan 1,4-beta-xylosidase
MAGSDSAWLSAYLEHTLRGDAGRALDLVAFHAKGAPAMVDGHVRMGMAEQLRTMDRGFATIAGTPRAASLPVVIGESDPDGCAACRGAQYGYRNGALYASYTTATIAHAWDLAARRHVALEGVLTWAFEFEDQAYFPGFRVLADNSIDHPVLNAFRFLARLPGRRVQAVSSGALPLDSILSRGVRSAPDVGVVAARDSNRLAILAWHYHDDDVAGPAADLEIAVRGLPGGVGEVVVTRCRIDEAHGNAYTAWLAMGSPVAPSDGQRAQLQAAAAATEASPPERARVVDGALTLRSKLARQGVELIEVRWEGRR